MEKTKRIWVWVGVAVVVIGVIFFFAWSRSNKLAKGPTPVFAEKGQLTPQFPKELVLHALAGVTNSYSIAYASSTNQYTAEFNSSSSMQFIYTDYLQYLLASGWKIQKNVLQPTVRALSASTSSADVSILIVQQGAGSHITIGYLTK